MIYDQLKMDIDVRGISAVAFCFNVVVTSNMYLMYCATIVIVDNWTCTYKVDSDKQQALLSWQLTFYP